MEKDRVITQIESWLLKEKIAKKDAYSVEGSLKQLLKGL